jgi:hypothetical protein
VVFSAPMLPLQSLPPLLPYPPAVSSPRRATALQRAYEAYATAYTAAQAVDSPYSYHTSKTEAERAQMRAERWPKVIELHGRYADLLAKATNQVQPKPQQTRLFADAWPPEFMDIAERFPHRPYVSDDLTFTRVRPLDQAMDWRYVQHNPPAHAHLLVIDYDGDAPGAMPAIQVWQKAGLPTPAWVACTPGTPKGHLAWALAAPVCTTSAGRLAPLRYLAAIEQAYKTAMTGDEGYVGLLTKNPVYNGSDAWEMHWLDPTPRTLDDLAAAVELPKPGAKAAPLAPVGFGRKVTTFDTVRHWAYSAISSYWGAGEDAWHRAVRQQVENVNRGFSESLPDSHLRSISKSIAKWTWKRFTPESKHLLVMATHTPAVQSMRGRLKGARRREELMGQVKEMAAAGATQRAIQDALGVPQKTVSRWLLRS